LYAVDMRASVLKLHSGMPIDLCMHPENAWPD